ncbi:ATP-dependent helicase HrpB [Holophaga foetida]|uniref:ATP-dependent helicase HrpB n=1 Tax=Holophaga foetida TaxID=35839 RepID=UPI00031CAC4A|nr:ATP-dependent helicase HrpB [Holophaga foetida]
MPLNSLPIDSLLSRIVEVIRGGRDLVLTAEPGAGKTTRVPRALLDSGLLKDQECWVLEPRRLAARLAAARVAEELGEEPGQRVGYAVRFEHRVSAATRVRFVTEGLLLRRFQEDPELKGIGIVILDEFHERHLQTDVALTLLKRLQARRPELCLVVMSATLDAEPIAAYLGAELLRSEGRAHPVELRHARSQDDRPLAQRVAETLEGLDCPGHTLVFLPGAAEIRACMGACEELGRRRGLKLLPLHGSLSFEAQQAAVAPSREPKVIFSTNVAESSVTLDGVRTVIDSGLGREAQHSVWSGLSSLRTARISRARCVQRAGRAGRQGPGLCIRLFTEADFRARLDFDPPEMLRSDWAETLLGLHGAGVEDPAGLPWFETPPAAALAAAEALLQRLGALEGGRLTSMGRRMVRLPLHPRLARLVLAGEEAGIPELARLAAALLETGDLSARGSLERRQGGHALASDLWPRLDAFREAEAARFAPGACRAAGLDTGAVRQAHLAFKALGGRHSEGGPADGEERLLLALLRAYPDRVARAGGSGTFALVGGTGARLDPGSRVRRSEWILALEADEVIRGTGREVLVRAASSIEPEWLLEAFPERLQDRLDFAWNPDQGRVERRSSLWYEDLCVDETRRRADADDPRTAEVLARAAQDLPLEGLDALLDRLAFLGRARPELGLGSGAELRHSLLAKGCLGCGTLKELQGVNWAWAAKELLGSEGAKQLDAWAPESVALPKRRVKVNYGGEAPWIESRLQDFLGMKEGPRVAGGSVPLVLHLLAPNFRAVQVTKDLAGFWQRAYQELRPQLSRRYPRHLWPEDPLKAEAPERR